MGPVWRLLAQAAKPQNGYKRIAVDYQPLSSAAVKLRGNGFDAVFGA